MSGYFTISLDTEIAWGTYSAPCKEKRRAFDSFPEIFQSLLSLFDTYEMPVTWAIVGHLLLSRGETVSWPRPHYAGQKEPDSARAPDLRNPHWYYFPDLVDRIREAKVEHELASHTFTHMFADDPGTSLEAWRNDLRDVVAVSSRYGFKAKSLVYPQNRLGYLETLPEFGFTCYRGVQERFYNHGPWKSFRRIFHILDVLSAATPPTYPLPPRSGELALENLPASQFLMPFHGYRRWIPSSRRTIQASRGLHRAVERDECFHLWFHPFNVGVGHRYLNVLEEILVMARRLSETRGLKLTTMSGLLDASTFS